MVRSNRISKEPAIKVRVKGTHKESINNIHKVIVTKETSQNSISRSKSGKRVDSVGSGNQTSGSSSKKGDKTLLGGKIKTTSSDSRKTISSGSGKTTTTTTTSDASGRKETTAVPRKEAKAQGEKSTSRSSSSSKQLTQPKTKMKVMTEVRKTYKMSTKTTNTIIDQQQANSILAKGKSFDVISPRLDRPKESSKKRRTRKVANK